MKPKVAAEQLIADRGINTLPICPFIIAKDKGIEVQPRQSDKPGVSGFLMRVGNQFGILYATHIKNDGFIRFNRKPCARAITLFRGTVNISFPKGCSLHEFA